MRLITPSSLGLGLSIKTEMGKSMDSENIVQGEEKNRLIQIRFVKQSGNEKTKSTTLVTSKQTKK